MRKQTSKTRAGNSARTARKKAPGKPFAKGNPFAFKPGQSGNPSGRPRDTITPHLRDIAQECAEDGKTYGRKVAEMLFTEALGIRNNVQAGKEIMDRLDGKPSQSISIVIEKQMREIFEAGVAILATTQGITQEEAARIVAEGVSDIYPGANDWIN